MKYRLLIAEDEEIDRIALHLLLSNEFPELEILDDADNGIEFVKIAEK
ncbi:MAG: DNA-binding response regulator, partial [Spirochaetes bacterium]